MKTCRLPRITFEFLKPKCDSWKKGGFVFYPQVYKLFFSSVVLCSCFNREPYAKKQTRGEPRFPRETLKNLRYS